MSFGAFTDKNYQPTETEVVKTLGPMLQAWHALGQFIRENFSVQEDFKFLYGKKYGWALQFRIKGILLTSLYPNDHGLTVQIILDPKAVGRVQCMKFGKSTQQVIASAYPYPEGRWLFIPVKSKNSIRDIQRLLALKSDAK
jgi:hypothetical protein